MPVLVIEESQGPENYIAKRRIQVGHQTIETKEDAFMTKKFDITRNFDPYFKQQSAKFDAVSVSGLLISSLELNTNLELLLESANPC